MKPCDRQQNTAIPPRSAGKRDGGERRRRRGSRRRSLPAPGRRPVPSTSPAGLHLEVSGLTGLRDSRARLVVVLSTRPSRVRHHMASTSVGDGQEKGSKGRPGVQVHAPIVPPQNEDRLGLSRRVAGRDAVIIRKERPHPGEPATVHRHRRVMSATPQFCPGSVRLPLQVVGGVGLRRNFMG